jgi:hypothetical protein
MIFTVFHFFAAVFHCSPHDSVLLPLCRVWIHPSAAGLLYWAPGRENMGSEKWAAKNGQRKMGREKKTENFRENSEKL